VNQRNFSLVINSNQIHELIILCYPETNFHLVPPFIDLSTSQLSRAVAVLGSDPVTVLAGGRRTFRKSNVAFFSAVACIPSWSLVTSPCLADGWFAKRPSRPQNGCCLPPYSPKVALRGPDPKSPACARPNDLNDFSLATFCATRIFFGAGAKADIRLSLGIVTGVSHMTERILRTPKSGASLSTAFPCSTPFKRRADDLAFCSRGDLSATDGVKFMALLKPARVDAFNSVVGREGISSLTLLVAFRVATASGGRGVLVALATALKTTTRACSDMAFSMRRVSSRISTFDKRFEENLAVNKE
jgi:hypothetical protein